MKVMRSTMACVTIGNQLLPAVAAKRGGMQTILAATVYCLVLCAVLYAVPAWRHGGVVINVRCAQLLFVAS